MSKGNIAKIVVGALFVLGGIGSLPDLIVAAFGLALGIPLVVLGIKSHKKQKEVERKLAQRAEEERIWKERSRPTYTGPIRVPSPAPPIVTPKKKSFISINKVKCDTKSDLKKFSGYISIDTETTGLDRANDRIIQIGIVEVLNGEVVDRYETKINPEMPISAEASRVHGMYYQDVYTAPKYSEIAPEIAKRLIGKTVIGYNVSFDLAFIDSMLSNAGISGSIDYLDILPLARKHIEGLPDYKLTTVCKALHIAADNAHSAGSDAIYTSKVFEHCKAEIERKISQKKKDAEAANAERRKKYEKSPLLDVAFVFTGKFKEDRNALESLTASVGAISRESVTRNTDFLVVGDISLLPDWAVSRKSGKADELIAKGGKVRKITEAEYKAMIEEAAEAIKK